MKNIFLLLAVASIVAGCSPEGDQGSSGSGNSATPQSSTGGGAPMQGRAQSTSGSVDIHTNQATRAGTTGADTQSGAQGNGPGKEKASIAR